MRSIDDAATARALDRGQCGDPFAVLGPHAVGAKIRVRSYQPQAKHVAVLTDNPRRTYAMERVGDTGLFVADLDRRHAYRLRTECPDGRIDEFDDPYRHSSVLGELDLHLIGEGAHRELYRKLGAHSIRHEGVEGVQFGVWAPNAGRVSVVGNFNDWDGRRHVMRRHPSVGIWELFVPGVVAGAAYKYELTDANGDLLPLKADPFAFHCEQPPGNASLVYSSSFVWTDSDWIEKR
ncbi:MAG: 1,4-alpha-glucan branching enzyme, partial [Gammaproteobacteria bacterium]|nr:1,4-alpha-glucan branching enzyme [Gammaproteobacteria bacterium]